MIVLGIETSCDETSASVVSDDRKILSNIVLSQTEEHSLYGGVVPEIAARSHLEHISDIISSALKEAGVGFDDLDGISATCGPGLIGGVIIGMMTAKAIACSKNIPFIAVNHLEAHALTPRLINPDIEFPYLLLLVSGGHTQLLIAEDIGKYHYLGGTIDDAAGECFDKSAKLMGLPYCGGVAIENLAKQCDNHQRALDKFPLPRPMCNRKNCDFSFSGLKTAVRNHVIGYDGNEIKKTDAVDLSYSLQCAIAEIIANRCENAINIYNDKYDTHHNGKRFFVASGGVAANMMIRDNLTKTSQKYDMEFCAPPVKLCSDNGAMVAWAGIERLSLGISDKMDFVARPRWPLGHSMPSEGFEIKIDYFNFK